MKNQLSETASMVLSIVRSDIKTMHEKLSVNCLDGSPMLLISNLNGTERVYGEWNGARGYIASELVPASLCGCVMMSPKTQKQMLIF